jgi:hypothetical protein
VSFTGFLGVAFAIGTAGAVSKFPARPLAGATPGKREHAKRKPDQANFVRRYWDSSSIGDLGNGSIGFCRPPDLIFTAPRNSGEFQHYILKYPVGIEIRAHTNPPSLVHITSYAYKTYPQRVQIK